MPNVGLQDRGAPREVVQVVTDLAAAGFDTTIRDLVERMPNRTRACIHQAAKTATDRDLIERVAYGVYRPKEA